MSLRDQLIGKGLVSKKRAKKLGREAKQERKQAQSSRRKKKLVEREEAQAEAEAKAAAKEQRLRERKAREEEREAHEHVYRVRQIIRSNRLGGRGPVPFAYRVGDKGRVRIMYLKEFVARELRVGRAAIAGFQKEGEEWEHHVVTRKGADKLLEVEPSAVVHLVRSMDHLKDPSQTLMYREWESGLGPHRVRDPAELEKLVARERARDEAAS